MINELLSRSRHPYIRDKVKAVLDLSNYATKERLDHATGVDTFEVDKLDINKFVHVPTSLNNLKTKVNGLDAGKLKTVPLDLKKLSDAVDNEVVKNPKFNTLKVIRTRNKI